MSDDAGADNVDARVHDDDARVHDDERHVRMSDQAAAPRVSLVTVAKRQRVTVLLAAKLTLAAVVVGVAFDSWLAGVFFAVGVGLSLLNALLTEQSMIRMTANGDDLSRGQFAMSALARLALISVVALALVIAFWPDGGLVLAGLALFQLLTIVLTGLPVLREMRES